MTRWDQPLSADGYEGVKRLDGGEKAFGSPIPTHAQLVPCHQSSGISKMTTTTTLTSLKFPRTGKRGVPQQFPRNLYDMLEAESKLIQADASHPKIISWSESGKAFRIHDVSEFSASVLPRYFRTKKFSSFQRNLNLVSVCFKPNITAIPHAEMH